jgi:hypothetical protein
VENIDTEERSRESFESVLIGAYDADAWNGIVFAAKAAGQSLGFLMGNAAREGKQSHSAVTSETNPDNVGAGARDVFRPPQRAVNSDSFNRRLR